MYETWLHEYNTDGELVGFVLLETGCRTACLAAFKKCQRMLGENERVVLQVAGA